jgi:hypothetical protein
LIAKAVQLLIKKGWQLDVHSNAQHQQVQVTPVPARKYLRNYRPGQRIGGARYWA